MLLIIGDMTAAPVIKSSHPSFGCNQAWFLFAKKGQNGGLEKLMLVEAKNGRAVQTIERMVAVDGHVADDLELMTVHRQCPSIGIRSDFVEEIDYVDFLANYADSSRIVSDSLISHTFQSSLTHADRTKLLATPVPSLPESDESSDISEDVVAALTDLGYKMPQAKRMVQAIGHGLKSMAIEDAISAALRNGKAV
jgi:hypothetical protein